MSDYIPPPPSPYEVHVSHYYGDQVRQLFFVAAALMLIGAPFYADSLRVELPFEVAGALILVALAALANPHNRTVFLACAIVSGVGVAIYEMWALYGFEDSTWVQFGLREAIAVILLIAFYFNMKTVRAFVLHQVGKHDEAGEFDEPEPQKKKTIWEGEFMPWFFRNEHNGGKENNRKKEEDAEDTGPRMSPGRKPEEIKPKYHPYEDTM
ncbi:hypothetical protein HYW59_02900 [Candidatus Kaiserbacteria bacterium]|nr:hypothetical protein [Candidatus Kaiserbacteria bacterium]